MASLRCGAGSTATLGHVLAGEPGVRQELAGQARG